jgi:phosphate transport system substrate-binding protein
MTKGFSVKLSRAGVIAAGVLAAVVALTACGSSGNSSSNTTAAAGGNGSTSAGVSSSAAAVSCATGSLKGEGSTAQKNVISEWIQKYQAKCSGATIAYNATGSGAGVQQFNGGQVDFGGSDAALSSSKGEVAAANKRCGGTAYNLPMVTIPIGVAFNVKGLMDLTLTPDVVAKMFQGTITSWDDPAIKALNSGANLPATKITVFFRSDASGTTQNFENYLAASAPSVYTATPSKNWSGKVGQGKKGNDGVQQGVKSVDGGLGYLEWSFVVSGGLNSAKINNGGGAVEMNADTAGNAVSAATVDASGAQITLKLNYATKVAGAYPITGVTYELVCEKYSDAKIGALVKSFFTYTSTEGQNGLADLGYAPLPSDIGSQVQGLVAKIS